MKRLILALILLVVVLITGCADAGRRDQDKKSVHSPTVTLGIERIGESMSSCLQGSVWV